MPRGPIDGVSSIDRPREPSRARCGTAGASAAGLLPHLVCRDDVVDLDVVVAAEVDTALEAVPDLGDVVLEAAQPLDVEVLRHDLAVAQQTGLGVPPDLAGTDEDTRDVAELGRAEDL